MRNAAFTLLEIMIVVAIISLLLSLAIPSFVKNRKSSQQTACIENLRKIEDAKSVWALERGKKSGDPVATNELIGPNAYLKSQPFCPGGGDYDYQVIDTLATCTITNHELR